MIEFKQPLRAPTIPRDFVFFYEGLRNHELLGQQCQGCGHKRWPIQVICPDCRSLEWQPIKLPLQGSLYSYVIHHYPVFPDYPSPNLVGLVEVEPGVRIVGAVSVAEGTPIEIGMPLTARFAEHSDGFVLHYFTAEQR